MKTLTHTTLTETADEIRSQIDELQLWFASKPYGWLTRATAGQRQQWMDRVNEEGRLIERLAEIEGR